MHRNFHFDVNLEQAYKSPEGIMHVVGVASDDMTDRTGDRMSARAVRKMVRQANSERLPLLDNHRATFGFGVTHSAVAREVEEKGKTVTQLLVDFELDPKYPQALDLFQEVSTGKAKKQLSIGGFLNTANPKAVSFEEVDGQMVRVIEDIQLEHIAATRPNMAAVPRTRFVSAIVKDLFADEDPANEKNKTGEPAGDEAPQSGVVLKNTRAPEKFVLAAMGALLSTHNETDLPANGRRGVYNHLAAHYRELDREPPVMRNYTTDEFVAFHRSQGIDLTKEDLLGSEEKHMSGEIKKDAPTAENIDPTQAAAAAAAPATPAAPAPAADVASDPGVVKGLAVLARIGKAFDEPQAPELSPELVAAEKAVSAFASTVGEGKLTEKSTAVISRMRAALNKLLSTEGQETPENEKSKGAPSPFALKDVEEIFVKTIDEKIDEKILKTFESSFNGLTEALSKGLVEMAEGFKVTLKNQVEHVSKEVGSLKVSADERLARLEKVGGVRQSLPGQDVAVATGAQPDGGVEKGVVGTSRRSPDKDNAFRGVFDKAKNHYMAQHR